MAEAKTKAPKTEATGQEFNFMLAEIRAKPPTPGESLDEVGIRLAEAIKTGRGLKTCPNLSAVLVESVLSAAGKVINLR